MFTLKLPTLSRSILKRVLRTLIYSVFLTEFKVVFVQKLIQSEFEVVWGDKVRVNDIS